MWKSQNERGERDVPAPPAKPQSMNPPAAPVPVNSNPAPQRVSAGADRPTHLSKTIQLKGTVTGNEDLYVDGKLEGSVELPKNVLTVGVNGQVQANVNAREVIILGKLNGNVVATDRVEIKAQGALTGDVSAARISIEDGAFFKGGIDIRKGTTASAKASA
ncbi:MAG: bactofilin family protein [Terriglobales bacterium]